MEPTGETLMLDNSKTIELQVQQYIVACLVDSALPADQFRSMVQYRAEYAAHQIVVEFQCLGMDVTPKDKIVARYPANLWQHIRHFLGFSCREIVVSQSERWLWPHIEIPKIKGKNHIVRVTNDTHVSNPWLKDTEYE